MIAFHFANDMFTIYQSNPIRISGTVISMAVVVILMYSVFISGLCLAIASMSIHEEFLMAAERQHMLHLATAFPSVSFTIPVNGFNKSLEPIESVIIPASESILSALPDSLYTYRFVYII